MVINMKILILSFSSNKVNEDSYIPNKIGLTFSCVQECAKHIKENGTQHKNCQTNCLEKFADFAI